VAFRMSLLKTIDAIIGPVMASILPSPRAVAPPETIGSLLIIRPGGIGDAILVLPMLQAVVERYQTVAVTVLAERRNSAVFVLSPVACRVLRYDTPAELITAMQGEYDCIIDTEQSHYLSVVIARFCRSAITIGFDTNQRRRLLTHPVPYSQDDYEVDSFLNLLSPLGIESPPALARFVTIPPAASEKVAPKLEENGCNNLISIFPGASIAERKWGTLRFRELACKLHQAGFVTIVIGGAAERESGDQIVAGGVGINLAGTTSVAETAALVDASQLLITADSGMLHLAVALDKPSVSLFGPGRQKKWAPRGDRHVVLNKELPCSPCTTFGDTPACRDAARCMREIGVDETFNAVMMLLNSSGAMPGLCSEKMEL